MREKTCGRKPRWNEREIPRLRLKPMIEMFTGAAYTPVEGPLTLNTLRHARRALLNHSNKDCANVLVRISKDLAKDAAALPGFIPVGFYFFSEVGMENELGRVEVFTISTT